MKTIAYLRVSTDMQGKSGAGLSAQLIACEKFATNGIHTVYQDVASGSSAGIEKRTGLFDAIKSLGRGDVLLVAKRDRLARDPTLVAMIEKLVTKKHATIMSADGFGNGTGSADILMKRIIDAMAEYERSLIAGRTKASLQAKKIKGERTGYIPLGKKLAEDGKHLIACATEQAVIALILGFRKLHMSLREIADKLLSLGYIKRNGKPYNHVNLCLLINKHNYAGVTA